MLQHTVCSEILSLTTPDASLLGAVVLELLVVSHVPFAHGQLKRGTWEDNP